MAEVVRVNQLFLDAAFFLHAFDFNALWFIGDFARNIADDAIQSCREQQGLTVVRRGSNNGFDVVNKTHVQHAVGFVQNQHFQT